MSIRWMITDVWRRCWRNWKFKSLSDLNFLYYTLRPFIPQEIVQVFVRTLEFRKVGCWFKAYNRIKLECTHLIQLLLGSLMTASYILRDSSISSCEACIGCSMFQRKFSKSFPESTGVSLIGLAIIVITLRILAAKIT